MWQRVQKTALRRRGWNAITFNYRGSWGSPGTYRFSQNPEDARAVLAFLRKAEGQTVLAICNFTPVPWHGYRVGVPATGASHWQEILNTDSQFYGGSNLGNGMATIPVEAQAAHGRDQSLLLTLPPLATLILEPC